MMQTNKYFKKINVIIDFILCETEDEMVGQHYPFSGHEFEQTLGDTEGQESLVWAVHGVSKSWTQLSI